MQLIANEFQTEPETCLARRPHTHTRLTSQIDPATTCWTTIKTNNNKSNISGQPLETPKKKHVDCSIQKINWTTHDDDNVAS